MDGNAKMDRGRFPRALESLLLAGDSCYGVGQFWAFGEDPVAGRQN